MECFCLKQLEYHKLLLYLISPWRKQAVDTFWLQCRPGCTPRRVTGYLVLLQVPRRKQNVEAHPRNMRIVHPPLSLPSAFPSTVKTYGTLVVSKRRFIKDPGLAL